MNTLLPTKYQSRLIIDSDAMKTSQITFQRFEPIGGWGPLIVQTVSAIQNIQFTQGNSDNFGREASHTRCFPSMKQIFRRCIPKGENCHNKILTLTRHPCKGLSIYRIKGELFSFSMLCSIAVTELIAQMLIFKSFLLDITNDLGWVMVDLIRVYRCRC